MLLLLLFSGVGLSMACSPPHNDWVSPTVNDQSANAAVVLSGRVMSVNAAEETARVEVINYFRGCGKAKIEVVGVKETSLCGAGLPNTGDEYMFYLCDGARINQFDLHTGMLPASRENKAIASEVCGAGRRPETCDTTNVLMVDTLGNKCGSVNSAVPPPHVGRADQRQRRKLLAKLGDKNGGPPPVAGKEGRKRPLRDLRRERDDKAEAARKNPIAVDRTTTIDACLDVIYACEHYGDCCGGGNYARGGHKAVCTKAKPFSVGGNCRAYDTHAGEM